MLKRLINGSDVSEPCIHYFSMFQALSLPKVVAIILDHHRRIYQRFFSAPRLKVPVKCKFTKTSLSIFGLETGLRLDSCD